jgi:hypothetical protein
LNGSFFRFGRGEPDCRAARAAYAMRVHIRIFLMAWRRVRRHTAQSGTLYREQGMNIKNIKISVRLAACFGILVAVMCLITGWACKACTASATLRASWSRTAT